MGYGNVLVIRMSIFSALAAFPLLAPQKEGFVGMVGV
jgi:hypothetical protein